MGVNLYAYAVGFADEPHRAGPEQVALPVAALNMAWIIAALAWRCLLGAPHG
jgi:hypothetical protein